MHIKDAVRYLPVVAFFSLLAILAPAQTGTVTSRITQAIDASKLTTLSGNTHPLALAKFDRGVAPANLSMDRMMLVLKRSPEQEAALETFMRQQVTRSSPNYHKWLTPTQFGEQYGPSDEDIRQVTSWLQSNGFNVNRVSSGKTIIEFSGTADEVQRAFHTAIHRYNVNGEDRWANSSDPKIPTALTPVVAGPGSLNSFPKKAMHRIAGTFTRNNRTGKVSRTGVNPAFTYTCGTDCENYAVGPYDFAAIYNLTPVWNAGITGTGEKIAIVADSNINVSDVTTFRSLFGLPVNNPTVYVNGTNPGILNGANGTETEAVLDTEWSGAVAENAAVTLVVSADTTTTFGGDLSAEYIIENAATAGSAVDGASILSYSYGECELGVGTAGNAMYNTLWQQAASEGITVLISTGDSGSPGCDDSSETVTTPQPAELGLAVSGEASTPYNLAVGGTDFNQNPVIPGGNTSTYWNTTNTATTQASAKGYMPETTWNDSCTNSLWGTLGGLSTDANTNCNNTTLSPSIIVTVGGNGGVSACTTSDGQTVASCSGGYAKPAWQVGAGVPNDGKRDLPDVSMFASDGFLGSFYIVCQADMNTDGNPCNLNSPYADFVGVGGTSVSVQVFAGIMALVNEKAGSAQGLANPELYELATTQVAADCNTSSPASGCVFNDVTVGTNAQPCASGSPDCTIVGTDAYGILTGYNAGVGFDLATGLGSVNIANLVNAWDEGDFVLSAAPTAVTIASAGLTGTTVLTVAAAPAPNNNYTGTIDFTGASCSGLPALTTCSFSPATVTGTGTTTITITTTKASKMVPAGKPTGWHGPVNNKLVLTFALSTMLLLLFYQARRPRWSATAALLMCFSLAVLAGCGGGGGGGGGSGSTGTPGTPVTTDAVITVTGVSTTGSSTITHNTTFTLTVQ
ncbi:MAG: S53 family peptidase [Candidatus Acidiferrales bacterium]